MSLLHIQELLVVPSVFYLKGVLAIIHSIVFIIMCMAIQRLTNANLDQELFRLWITFKRAILVDPDKS